MTIKTHTLSLGDFGNLIYIIEDLDSKEAFLVDPSWEISTITDYLRQNSIKAIGILLTHSHYDHITGLERLQKESKLPVYVCKEEFSIGNLSKISPTFINDDEYIKLGSHQIKVIKTPGHTKGSTCFYIDGNLFSGDTLFINGCGRCDFAESQINKMFSSIDKLKQLPDDTIIRPGHICDGLKTSTIYEQKQNNPYLIIDNEDFFIRYRQGISSNIRKTAFTPTTKEEMIEIEKEYS